MTQHTHILENEAREPVTTQSGLINNQTTNTGLVIENLDWQNKYPLNTLSETSKTEFIEFIDNLLLEQKKQILQLESLKEEDVSEETFFDFKGWKREERRKRNQLLKQIKDDITNLINK